MVISHDLWNPPNMGKPNSRISFHAPCIESVVSFAISVGENTASPIVGAWVVPRNQKRVTLAMADAAIALLDSQCTVVSLYLYIIVDNSKRELR